VVGVVSLVDGLLPVDALFLVQGPDDPPPLAATDI
jgi:hypothetical protein